MLSGIASRSFAVRAPAAAGPTAKAPADFAAALGSAASTPAAGDVGQFLGTFPPADAPLAFQRAWASTTANLDPRLRMAMALKLDSAVRGILPGATSAASSGADGTDYAALVDKMVASAKFGLGQARTDTQRGFGSAMLDAFETLKSALAAS